MAGQSPAVLKQGQRQVYVAAHRCFIVGRVHEDQVKGAVPEQGQNVLDPTHKGHDQPRLDLLPDVGQKVGQGVPEARMRIAAVPVHRVNPLGGAAHGEGRVAVLGPKLHHDPAPGQPLQLLGLGLAHVGGDVHGDIMSP